MEQYNQIGNTTPKRNNDTTSNILKVGCGCLIGVVLTIGIFLVIGILGGFDNISSDQQSYEPEPTPVQYFQVESGKGQVTLHTGMPKDSVLLLLGQPTELRLDDYTDRITYRFGKNNFQRLEINFEEQKLISVYQD